MPARGNPGLNWGSSSATAGGRAATRCASRRPTDFGLWAEQLIAESTGKQGKGLIPAPGESFEGPDRQGAEVHLADPYAIGGEFFRWEFAVAVAGSILEINPFDQPDVQAAKDKTKEVLASGDDPSSSPRARSDELLALRPSRRLRRDPGLHRSDARTRAPAAGRPRPRDQLRRDEGARPALPPLDRPAPQGRPARPASSSRWSTTQGDEIKIPGEDFGFGALDPRSGRRRLSRAAGTWPPIARVRLDELVVQLGMIGLGRMGGT